MKQTGALRPGLTFLDVAFLLELLAKTRLGDTDRTAELKQRQLAILIDGLRAQGSAEFRARHRRGRSRRAAGRRPETAVLNASQT